MTNLPPHPWYTVHTDFCGPFPSGEKFLVITDAYFRYLEVEIMNNTASAVISNLHRNFTRHGYSKQLVTDNG